jgi:hypothetical protein
MCVFIVYSVNQFVFCVHFKYILFYKYKTFYKTQVSLTTNRPLNHTTSAAVTTPISTLSARICPLCAAEVALSRLMKSPN